MMKCPHCKKQFRMNRFRFSENETHCPLCGGVLNSKGQATGDVAAPPSGEARAIAYGAYAPGERCVPPHPVVPDFVLVRGRTARRNATPGGAPPRKPFRPARVADFYVSRHLVSQDDWCALGFANVSHFRGRNLPVENVSWYEAVEYCNVRSLSEGLPPCYAIAKDRMDPGNLNLDDPYKWIVRCDFGVPGYRLPTCAEWEYAAWGGPFGRGRADCDEAGLSRVAWFASNSGGRTQPLGTKEPNDIGLYDMYGNVWEWCWNWFRQSSSRLHNLFFGLTDAENNVGSCRECRGGSWATPASRCIARTREFLSPSGRDGGLGFRLVRTAT